MEEELKIEDLNKEANMIFGIDPENYPWFSIYEKNGKFSLVENNFGEFGMGYDPQHYLNIAEPFTYDSVRYYELRAFDYSTPFYRIFPSYSGYIALGRKNVWDIFCLDAWSGCMKMMEEVAGWEEAISTLSNRIGYEPRNWKELTHWLKYTPDNITSLEDNQIFIFGSNIHGSHGGGAARYAFENFGAIMGQGVGLQGQSYAIPTMFGSVDEIKPYVDEFIQFAREHGEMEFLVTKIGCGIASFSEKDIAPLFEEALWCRNIVLPKSFVDILWKDRG